MFDSQPHIKRKTFTKKQSRAATIVVGLAVVIFHCHRFPDCVFCKVFGLAEAEQLSNLAHPLTAKGGVKILEN